MLHVFKKGGAWKTKQGEEYTVKAVHNHEFHDYLADGWFSSLEDCFALVSDDDYKKELRDQIKALGGKPAGSSSVEKLEKQLEELQNDN